MRYCFKYGNAVTTIPSSAVEKMITGAASPSEIAVLMAISTVYGTEAENEEGYTELLADITGLGNGEVESALAFWRGASVILPSGRSKNSSATESKRGADTVARVSGTKTPSAPTMSDGIPIREKKLMREEPPRYSPEDIARLVGHDGGALSEAIEQCQRILGRVFNPSEVEVIVRLNDHLGLEPEYILTLCAYYSKKKPGCRLHYIEKAAYSLANDGITTLEALEAHIRSMEIYDGIAGHLRKLTGMGSREFTKKENSKIKHWINELGYGEDIIELCYEITVDSIGEFSFDYADKILDNWYLAGIRTPDQAREANLAFKEEREKRRAASDNGSGVSAPSFDGDEFLRLAIKRSLDG